MDIKYPFEVDDDDHCETPIEAFADIAVLLEKYAMELNKTKESLIIYDPYFCEGSSSLRLKSLGFPQVYNKKEDFYQRMQNGLPIYDVIVTNPPYSGDHIERLVNFVFASNKPWFLLIPNFVYMKPYYTSKLGNRSSLASSLVFYVTPLKRYLYSTPKVNHVPATHVQSSYDLIRDVGKRRVVSILPRFRRFGSPICTDTQIMFWRV